MSRRALPKGLPLPVLEEVARTLRVLAHPLRLKILERLTFSEATVQELARHLHRPHAVVSQHVNLMRLHGLLRRRPQGRHAWYQVADPEALSLLQWIHQRQFARASFRDGEAI